MEGKYKKLNKVWTIVLVIVAFIIYELFNFYYHKQVVSNFQECVDAGNPVMESYPRQCRNGEELFIYSNTPITRNNPSSRSSI